MISRIVLIFLFLYSSIAFTGNLPDTLYKITLGDSINEIKGTRKAGSMSGMYRVPFDEKQLVDPPNKFILVKVHRNNSRINTIIGESVSTKSSCPNDAKKLKDKYGKTYGIQFEQRKVDKNLHDSIQVSCFTLLTC